MSTKTVKYVPLSTVCAELDKDFHQNVLYDFNGANLHFYKWCDKKGYGEKDGAGKQRGSSQIWYKEYQNDPEGEAACPEVLNFLDFAAEQYLFDPQAVFVYVDEEDCERDYPEWVLECVRRIHNKFKHHFEDGTVVICQRE